MYIQCVDDTRDITENGQQNVDQEVCAATTLKEDSERGEDNGDDDLDDVSVILSATRCDCLATESQTGHSLQK